MDSTEVLTAARSTTAEIQADPRLAVTAFNKRLLIESLEKEIGDLSTKITEAREAWRERIETVTEVATEHANEVSWCEEFDRAMEEAGLECKRNQSVEVTFTVSIDTEVEVEVDVSEQVESILDDIDGAIDTSHRAEEQTISVDVTVEFDGSTIVEDVRIGSCACDSIDRYPDRYEASTYGSDIESFIDNHGASSITVSNVECTNCA